jgi:cytochrome c oxidase subunit 6a
MAIGKGHGSQDMSANSNSSVAVPCIIVATVNAKIRWDAHWEHVAHEEHENPRAERPEYSYQNIRTKNYFWGDGDKVCNTHARQRPHHMLTLLQTLFWNDKVNYHKKDE